MLIQEVISEKLFHFTDVKALVKILTENRFRLTSVLGAEKDTELQFKISKKLFYLSTMRSKTSSYSRVSVLYGKCFIHLDGRKLNQKYKGLAVDYYQEFDFKEFEDRVVNDKPEIPNAKSYIEKIDIFIDTEFVSPMVMKAVIECRKSDIPVNIYISQGKFLSNYSKPDLSIKELIQLYKQTNDKNSDIRKSYNLMNPAKGSISTNVGSAYLMKKGVMPANIVKVAVDLYYTKPLYEELERILNSSSLMFFTELEGYDPTEKLRSFKIKFQVRLKDAIGSNRMKLDKYTKSISGIIYNKFESDIDLFMKHIISKWKPHILKYFAKYDL